MENTHFVDVDLAFRRVPQFASDLTELGFADLEPLDDGDVVGVQPMEAVALIPPPPAARPFAPRPFTVPPLRPEDLETEEFVAFG